MKDSQPKLQTIASEQSSDKRKCQLCRTNITLQEDDMPHYPLLNILFHLCNIFTGPATLEALTFCYLMKLQANMLLSVLKHTNKQHNNGRQWQTWHELSWWHISCTNMALITSAATSPTWVTETCSSGQTFVTSVSVYICVPVASGQRQSVQCRLIGGDRTQVTW